MKTALKGNVVNTNGELPAVGTKPSDFTLVKTDLSEISTIDLIGRRVVINVFPSIDTGVCAASVRRFNKEASNLPNTTVLCVSKDLPFALGRFCGAEGLKHVVTASAFRCTSFQDAFGLLMIDGPLAGLLARTVIILNEDGKVIYTELVPEISEEPNYDKALAALK